MSIVIHKAQERGEMNIGWLHARYSFSFAQYHNPKRMSFGPMQVCNHDSIAPGKGFAPHSHKNFEIITIPLHGVVAHKDSLGNEGSVSAGEVQTMSAGTGVTHSEFNASDSEALELFQIWIKTEVQNRDPQYDQHSYLLKQEGRQVIASREKGAYIESSSQVEYVNTSQYLSIQLSPEHSYFMILTKGKGRIQEHTQANEIEPFDSLEVKNMDVLLELEPGTSGYLITL